jgi:hypothetical protein
MASKGSGRETNMKKDGCGKTLCQKHERKTTKN